ncbi:DUF3443 family protein [Ancylobacter radicis]|uniref:DUF3443 family protein n=1 Tax=Ancylobacter radicis TaxID=2836179 RepID=A0ABS5R5K5_9HYPH|nr:DUF3443 family protein [Ancylobacter radicis]MBS9476961.1 DUF3443 family protein [Ancylobacter radicis]
MRRAAGYLVICLCAGGFAPSHAQDSATIPLHQFYKTAHPDTIDYNPYYYTNVAVGDPGNTVNHVLVDTGSTGLYILESSLDSGSYTATSTRFSYSYSSGNRFKGYMVYGTIYFLGAKNEDGHDITLGTSAPIAFGVITDSECKESKPDCGGLRAISHATNPNNYGWNVNQAGTMGIAYQGGQDIFNPLGQLPGTYANGFIVAANQATSSAQPVLVVGLNSDNTAGYVFTPFQSQGMTGANLGLPAWNTKSILTCFSAEG